MHGGTYAERRYSPGDQIEASNVGERGLAWSFGTGRCRRVPIVVEVRLGGADTLTVHRDKRRIS